MYPNKEKGFLTFHRELPHKKSLEERLESYTEYTTDFSRSKMREQGYRCMNCGVPFCHDGCPLGNIIPDFNDFVKNDDWKSAIECLHSTNNFPEFTGRVCPAPCEAACVLGIIDPPVNIKLIERHIIDRAWEEGWITPQPAEVKTGKTVAIVGAGPAGLAAAQQLARAGHDVTVFERSEEVGGLLSFGIPDFKMEKHLVYRRRQQMEAEGVVFRTSVEVGKDISAKELLDEFDAVLLTIGSTVGRTLPIPGGDLKGVYLAMQFLPQQNRRVAGKEVEGEDILATDKRVVILGGGDTGNDCLGTSLRQGAKSVTTFELLPKPPEGYNPSTPWPLWPIILRSESSHEEGGERDWSVLTKELIDDGKGHVKGLKAVKVDWETPEGGGRPQLKEIEGSEFEIECDLLLLALGFLHPEPTIPEQLGLELDERGNIKAEYRAYATSNPKVWAAGDARRGQSLVVWAIHEGREAARCIDLNLMGRTDLPSIHDHGYDVLNV